MSYQDRLLKAIPGGCHTYSRGFDQFPPNAPQILTGGKGAYVFDENKKSFLDYGMGLRSVNIGYANDEIDAAAISQIRSGNNLTRASMVELEAAELMIDLIDSVEMVKFAKNGSSAVTAAVKLARAYTGRDKVVRCLDHPFFSYDDWFIGSTVLTKGVPLDAQENTLIFRYNDITSLDRIIDQHKGKIACVILEPSTINHPLDGFLNKVRDVCTREGIVFILDEMITGFRWDLKGAQHLYKVKPDLTTFGKAMSNGFSLSCVGGAKDIMKLGSIEKIGEERVFLLSSTHGAEMSSLGAFIATVKFMNDNNLIDKLWKTGSTLINSMNDLAQKNGLGDYFKAGGVPCSPIYETCDHSGKISNEFRTLFCQEMIRNNVLMPWIALSHSHDAAELEHTKFAVDCALKVYKAALTDGVEKYLDINKVIKPVFRKYN